MPNESSITPLIRSATSRREVIRENTLQAIKEAFPIIGSRVTLDLQSPAVQQKTYSSNQQKNAIIEGKSVVEPVKGTLVLKDNKTGRILDKRRTTIAHIPWFTPRNTFIVDGNEYSVSSQLRLRPGIYTRVRGNQELEAQFNLSKGKNFKVQMAPDTGVFTAQFGTTHIPIYGILKSLGVSDSQIQKEWGSDLLEINRAAWSRGGRDRLSTLFSKIFPSHRGATTTEEKITMLRDYFNNTRMDPNVNAITIGKKHEKVSGQSILDASGKLLRVFNKKEEPDDRDNLRFKTIHQVEDLLAERIRLDSRKITRKIKQRLDHTNEKDVKKIISTAPFTKGIKSFLTISSLSRLPSQYNPLEILDASQRITSLGEGGIENSRAIMPSARTVHPSHLGVIDPVVTSEAGDNVGIDVRATFGAAKDKDGRIYVAVYDTKNNRRKYLPIDQATSTAIAFPEQAQRFKKRKEIAAIKNGKIVGLRPNDVEYRIPSSLTLHGSSANLLPFLNSMQGNRALMASKHITQALPLKEKEAPLVQVELPSGKTAEEFFGRFMSPSSPVAGVVDKIDHDFIYIKPKNVGTKTAAAGAIKLPYDNNFPLATKTYLHNDISVRPGDKVKTGQLLGDSVITKDGVLAYGKNLRVALMAYKGLNSNDAVVISEDAAKKLTSTHMYKEMLIPTPETVVSKSMHMAQFGNKYTRQQYAKLSDNGVIKKGQEVLPGDLLIAALEKRAPSLNMSMLGKLHKSLVKPYNDIAVTWEHEHKGTVIDVFASSRRIVVTVKTEEPMKLGDKLSGRHGNKGVVSMILPNEQMPRDEQGRPIDVLMTSAGVVSRINPSQVLEMAVGKVAEKTGKPIAVPSYAAQNNIKFAKKLLKHHKLKDKETVYDPVTGKKIPGIMVGPQYIIKLMKTTDTNFSARGIERYDVNQQPSKGGSTGAKSLGMMEFSALVAHGAKNILKDAATIKGQRNDEYWQRVRLGLPPPPVKTSFAYNKFGAMLTSAGVKFDKDKDLLRLTPLTDADVSGMSSGRIKNPLLLKASNLKPEKGGLFDNVVTGGPVGTKWSHIELEDRVVNPVFSEPVRRLLGITQAELDKINEEQGGDAIRKKLNSIDLNKLERDLINQTKTTSGSTLDSAVKTLKYVRALKKLKLKPGDAYTLKKIPVLPPVMRPVLPDKKGNILVNDTNYLYRDVLLANDSYRAAKDISDETRVKAKKHLQKSVSALFGLSDPVSPQATSKNARGFISLLAGRKPKEGFIQSKLLSKRQDLSGRGTVIPDINLNMDEIGIPEDMAWSMYEPFIIRRLVSKGYSAVQAKKMFEDKHPAAKKELEIEVKERPVYWNRAPTLHRFNIVGAYPKLVKGKSIRIAATWPEEGMNMDYDGDAVQVHVPVSPGAVAETKKITLPNLLFSDKLKTSLLVKPQHEAIVGLNKMQYIMKKPGGKYVPKSDVDTMVEQYLSGKIALHDKVK